MENLSKKYAEVQLLLLNLEKAANDYEQHEQTPEHAQALVQAFSKTFQAFCDLIAEYLAKNHKNFASGKNPHEIITNAHKAGFLDEHDTKILLQAAKEKESTLTSHHEVPPTTHPVKPHLLNISPSLAEIPLIHNLETYIETMQTIISEIKP